VPNFVEIAQTTQEICQFSIIKDGARRHLRFWKFQIFNSRNGQERNLVKVARTAAEKWLFFDFFEMAAAAILDFRNFKFLTVETRKGVELHYHAKFRRNRSNRD